MSCIPTGAGQDSSGRAVTSACPELIGQFPNPKGFCLSKGHLRPLTGLNVLTDVGLHTWTQI
jgi:hypothetical protein